MRHDFAVDWMADFEAYAAALEAGGDASYASTLSRSLALVLDRWGVRSRLAQTLVQDC